MKLYLFYIASILSPSLLVLACIDRLMLSSPNLHQRRLSRTYFAYRLIIIVSIFWILFSIHELFGAIILSGPNSAYCYIRPGLYTIFSTFYMIIINHLLPPILMIILGLMTIINVRRAPRRVHQITGRVLFVLIIKNVYMF